MMMVMINTTDPVMVSAIGHIPTLYFLSKQASDMLTDSELLSVFGHKAESKTAFQLLPKLCEAPRCQERESGEVCASA